MEQDHVIALARELLDAHAAPRLVALPPSAREGGLDLATAYQVEAAIADLRRAGGHAPVGLKVGYANKAVWRALKLDTLAWAHMYDDTVAYAEDNSATLDLSTFFAPKIEPEIVFKLKRDIDPGVADAAAVLDATQWIALGFEIIDCVFPDWQVQPVDFVAAKGLHARLVVGTPRTILAADIPELVEQLSTFTVTLSRDGEVAAQGSGRNALRNPALCIAELARALDQRNGAAGLHAGTLISSGTLTESQLLGPNQAWTAQVEGIDLPALTVHTSRG